MKFLKDVPVNTFCYLNGYLTLKIDNFPNAKNEFKVMKFLLFFPFNLSEIRIINDTWDGDAVTHEAQEEVENLFEKLSSIQSQDIKDHLVDGKWVI